jgi:hypothetical protein
MKNEVRITDFSTFLSGDLKRYSEQRFNSKVELKWRQTGEISRNGSGGSIKLLRSMDRLKKLLSDINEQVKHYSISVCLIFFQLSPKLVQTVV